MTDKIHTLSNTPNKNKDQWAEAYALLAQKHPITAIETRLDVGEIITSFPSVVHFEEEVIHTAGYSTRNLKLLDRNKNIVYVCQNVEVDGNKLFIRETFQHRTSWFNYVFSRFRRTPNVNINIRR